MIKHVILPPYSPVISLWVAVEDWYGASTLEQSPKLAPVSSSVRHYLKFSWIQFRLEDVTHVGFLDLDIFAAGESNRLPVLKGNE